MAKLKRTIVLFVFILVGCTASKVAEAQQKDVQRQGRLTVPQPVLPPYEILEGRLEVIVEDRFAERQSIEHYLLETNTELLPLALADAALADVIRPNSFIRIQGRREN